MKYLRLIAQQDPSQPMGKALWDVNQDCAARYADPGFGKMGQKTGQELKAGILVIDALIGERPANQTHGFVTEMVYVAPIWAMGYMRAALLTLFDEHVNRAWRGEPVPSAGMVSVDDLYSAVLRTTSHHVVTRRELLIDHERLACVWEMYRQLYLLQDIVKDSQQQGARGAHAKLIDIQIGVEIMVVKVNYTEGTF
jgi:uncharacterized phage-associated protein